MKANFKTIDTPFTNDLIIFERVSKIIRLLIGLYPLFAVKSIDAQIKGFETLLLSRSTLWTDRVSHHFAGRLFAAVHSVFLNLKDNIFVS